MPGYTAIVTLLCDRVLFRPRDPRCGRARRIPNVPVPAAAGNPERVDGSRPLTSRPQQTSGHRRDDQQREVDLLIAGAGPAGMTAALVASLQGLTVLICEKSDQVGGTGSTSAGTLWIPGNHQSRNAGFDDSAEQARSVSGRADRQRRRPRAAHRVSQNRAGRDRLAGAQQRREVPAVRTASGLSQQHERRGGRRPRDHSAAVRRTPAGRRFRPAAPADPRIHAVRRHDDRQGRYPAAARPLQVARQFQLRGKADGALSRRPAALPARHAADDGQCADRAAVLQPEKRGVEILFNAPIAAVDYQNGRVAGATINAADGEIHVKAQRASCSPPAAMGTTRAIATPSWRIRCPRIRWRANSTRATASPSANSSARASRRKNIAAAGYGRRLRHHAGGRQQGPLSAPVARPRQAGPDRGECARRTLCQRSRLVSRLCRGNVRRQRPRAVDSLLPDLRRGLHQKIRAGRGLSRRRQPAALAEIGISQARRHAGQPCRPNSASTRRGCAGRWSATTALRRPASMPTSARARPSSTASTATMRTSPIPASGRS